MARSLEIKEHLPTQQRIKAAQRIGVAVLLLMLLAALSGLFGLGGPAADARAKQGPLEVTYPRFARYLAPTGIEVRMDKVTGDSVTVALQGKLADAFHATTIEPRPDQVATTDDATVYRFAAIPGQPHRIRFDGQMEMIGPVSGLVRVDDGTAVETDTFVYP